MRSKHSRQTGRSQRRVLIADSHPLFRRGLAELIDSEPDLAVCAAVDANQASIQAIASCKPDIVITDVKLRRVDDHELLSEMRACDEEIPIIVLSLYDAPQFVRRLIRAGASSFVGKSERAETLLAAIRELLDGHDPVSPMSGNRPDAS